MNNLLAPIVLLTDFGHRDPFVGIMKGVILSRAPRAEIVDLCHEIAPQDIFAAALALRQSIPYFPKNSLFVVVVDPGVGTKRRILWAKTKAQQFLSPDNGALSWLPDKIVECRSVTNDKLFLKSASQIFHGRDKFASVAASLFNGLSASVLGPRIADRFRVPFPSPMRTAKSLVGAVLSFDHFGNAITNLSSCEIPPRARILHRGRDLGPLKKYYASVARDCLLAVAGSAGLVELSARGGDYAALTNARRGDPVHVRFRP